MSAPVIEFRNVTKRFGELTAVQDLHLTVSEGEVVSLIGPSRCLLVFGEGQGNTAMVFVTIFMLTLIGIVAYGGVVVVERRVLHYAPKAKLQSV